MAREFAWLTAAAAAVATLAMTLLPAAEALECYNCITTHPSWAKSKDACLKEKVKTNCMFCTKAEFPGLVVRGCATSGKEANWTDQSKMCKAYDGLTKKFTGTLKLLWGQHVKKFRASCPVDATSVKNKEPKKGFVCKKKLCNAASTSVLSSALILGAFLTLLYSEATAL